MFGSHLSVAGGLVNALSEAERLGFDTVQVFTKNQRQWKAAPLDPGASKAWADGLKRLGWAGRTVSHNSYLVNLASPSDELWEKSIAAQRDEIERCEALGIPFLVSHPGAHTGSGVEAGIARIAKGYTRLLKETAGFKTVVCIENTVGGGTLLGGPFEQLAAIRGAIAQASPEGEKRIGFCFDTCHAFAQGYDLRTAQAAAGTLAEFDQICGLGNLRVFHFNDSKGDFGSHRDRHEHIGHGRLGKGEDGSPSLEGLSAIVNHERLRGVPKILETPKETNDQGEDWDAVNLRLLRGLLSGARDGGEKKAPPPPRKTTVKTPEESPAKKAGSKPVPNKKGEGARSRR